MSADRESATSKVLGSPPRLSVSRNESLPNNLASLGGTTVDAFLRKFRPRGPKQVIEVSAMIVQDLSLGA